MDVSNPSQLLDLARSDGPRTLTLGDQWLGRLEPSDHETRSIVLRAMSIAARFARSMDDSVAHGQASVDEANLSGDPGLRALAMTTLAGSLAFQGRTQAALDLLDDAAAIAPRSELGIVHGQRGLVLSTRGEPDHALAAYSAALPLLEERGDPAQVAITLHNRGLLQVLRGDLIRAEIDLMAARKLHIECGHTDLLAGTEHNLGLLAAYRGDIPEALRRFSANESLERTRTGSDISLHVGRCETLLSAGLFREAFDEATRIYQQHKRHGRGEDEAEARLVAAQAALLAGETSMAGELAGGAARMFADQGRVMWVANSNRLSIQARLESGLIDSELLDRAVAVAEELDNGLAIPARHARLIAGLIAVALGDVDTATRELAKAAMVRSGPVELLLLARLATARLRMARGDRRGADAAARAGFRLLEQYQAALGASDIRSGVERHAAALGSLGLELAIGSRRARRVFTWMELTRARALRFRPVTPPGEEFVGELARARKLAADLRHAEAPLAARLSRELEVLQDTIKDRARGTEFAEVATPDAGREQLLTQLGGRTLVEFASSQGRLWALVVHDGRFRLLALGPESMAMAEVQSLRFMMRRLTRGRGRVGDVAQVADRLDRALLGRLPGEDEELVIVPTAQLQIVPWSALPSLRSRQVVISPSAHLWHRSHLQRANDGEAVLVAGPELELSDFEVQELSGVYRGAKVLGSSHSTVGAVQSHLDGAGIAHIASHAFFRYENPMFSSLRLADGDLYVYDIERLSTAPGLVVLSACDSGFTETHPGEELMGLSSALLSMGTRTIIASIGLVPDSEATKDLMVGLHQGLVSGVSPSQALHHAQREASETPEGYVAASSFICIGAG